MQIYYEFFISGDDIVTGNRRRDSNELIKDQIVQQSDTNVKKIAKIHC